MQSDAGFYRRPRRTWHVSSPILGPKNLLRLNIPFIGSGRSGKIEVRGGE